MRSLVLIFSGLIFSLLILFVIRGGYFGAKKTEVATPIELFSAEISLIDKMSVNAVNMDSYRNSRRAVFKRSFSEQLQGNIIKNADKGTLQLLRGEVFNYLLYVNDVSALSFLGKIYSRLEDEGALEEKQLLSLHKLYLTHRMFDKAAVYRQRHASLNIALPPEINKWVTYDNTMTDGTRHTINTVS